MKIYQKYILKELGAVFFLFLGSFYFLYVLVDWASNLKVMQQEGLSIFKVIGYYLFQFSSTSEILIPVALLVAVIKVATQLLQRNELTALMASGLALKKILRPFFFLGALCALFLYFNFQFIAPMASAHLDTFKNSYFKGNEENQELGNLRLKDGSLLLYGIYEPQRGAFEDAFWVVNHDEIYRIKTLFPFAKTPRGQFVDHLVRDNKGEIRKKESYETFSFPEMKFEQKALFEAVHPPEWQSLRALLKSLPPHPFSLSFKKTNDRAAKCQTIFFHKLTIPLLSLLVCLGVLPFCMQWRRHIPLFMIYALSLFGVITFFMLISATKILGESQLLPPLWAIFAPYLVCYTFFGIKYATL